MFKVCALKIQELSAIIYNGFLYKGKEKYDTVAVPVTAFGR